LGRRRGEALVKRRLPTSDREAWLLDRSLQLATHSCFAVALLFFNFEELRGPAIISGQLRCCSSTLNFEDHPSSLDSDDAYFAPLKTINSWEQ